LREEFVVIELLHKTKTSIHQITPKDHPTNRLEFDQCYYVDMLQSPTKIEERLKDIVNLNEIIPKLVYETQSLPNLIQKAMKLQNFLSLLHLPTRHTKGKEPLVDYS
jgi:hypothetical protein